MNKFRRWWERRFLLNEFVGCMVIFIAILIWSEICRHAFLEGMLYGIRSSLYSVMASVSGSLLGFIITTAAIIISFTMHDRMVVVRNNPYYHQLWDTYKQTLIVLLLMLIASVAGLLFDQDSSPCWTIFYLNMALFMILIPRLGRCIWILSKVMILVSVPVSHIQEAVKPDGTEGASTRSR